MNRILFVVLVLLLIGCNPAPTPIPPTATVVSFTATPVATATFVPTATPTITPSPTATSTATATATATLTPTPTATATMTLSPTPTNTATPVPTKTNTPTPAPRYPPVTLREPPDNQKRETVAITFQWEDIGINQDGDHYLVYVRRPTSPTWEKIFDAGRTRQLVWGREQNAGMGYGDFVWTAVVADAQNQVVSATGVDRNFYWCHPRSGCQVCSSCHK